MASTRVLILGIGNLLWADEGFGVRALEALQRRYRFAGDVTLLDGGTQGIYLLQHVQNADVLVIFDAVDYGLAPGTLKLVYDADVPCFMGAKKMSLHQTGFQEVLALAALSDAYPRRILLIGVQPEELEDYGGSLRDVVKRQLQPALRAALDFLAGFGIEAQPRDPDDMTELPPGPSALTLERYESERPSAEAACRLGDARYFGR